MLISENRILGTTMQATASGVVPMAVQQGDKVTWRGETCTVQYMHVDGTGKLDLKRPTGFLGFGGGQVEYGVLPQNVLDASGRALSKPKKPLPEELLHAAQSCNEEELQRLIAAGGDVNAFDAQNPHAREYMARPLHRMYFNGNPKRGIARMLVEAGADVNAEDKDKMTPLHLACRYRAELARVLLDAGADLTAKDKDVRAPRPRALPRRRAACARARARGCAAVADTDASARVTVAGCARAAAVVGGGSRGAAGGGGVRACVRRVSVARGGGGARQGRAWVWRLAVVRMRRCAL